MSLGESLIWLGLVAAMLIGVLVVIATGEPVEQDEGADEEAGVEGARAST